MAGSMDYRGEEAFAEMVGITHEGVVRDMAELMVMHIRDLIPSEGYHDTGHNRDSVDFREIDEEGKRGFRVFTESGYGAYLELGTSRIEARPTFAPAFDMAKKDVGL